MSDLALDLPTNDLAIATGDASLVTGIDAIVQNLQQTISLWYGEWFLDTTVGVPYRQQIIVKNPNMDVAQAALVTAATSVPGIIQLLDIEFQYSSTNRLLSVSIVAQASNGQTITAQANLGQSTDATIEGTPT